MNEGKRKKFQTVPTKVVTTEISCMKRLVMVDNDKVETNCDTSCDDSLNDFEESDEGVLSASNSESSSVSNMSARTKACITRKDLPNDPVFKYHSIMRLFLYALVKPETKAIIAFQMSLNE